MRILFVSTQFPIHPDTQVHGSFQRMEALVGALLNVAHVDLLFYVHNNFDHSAETLERARRLFHQKWEGFKLRLFLCGRRYAGKQSRWERIGLPIVSFYRQRNLRLDMFATSGKPQMEVFRNLIREQPDVLFVNRLSSMAPVLKYRGPLPPLIMDLDDIEHTAFLSQLRGERRLRRLLLLGMQLPALVWGERKAIKRTFRTLVCSTADKTYLQKCMALDNIAVVPNTVRLPPRMPPSQDPTVLLLGSYNYAPNIHAAEYLIEYIWPLIKRRLPDAKLLIAGGQPWHIAHFNRRLPDVEFTGFVKDLSSIYRRARLVCAPIFSGGGTRIKIIEAASFGIPVVATPFGARGLDYMDGEHILLAPDAPSLSAKCLDLLQNYDRSKQIGRQARKRTIELYSRNTINSIIRDIITGAVGGVTEDVIAHPS